MKDLTFGNPSFRFFLFFFCRFAKMFFVFYFCQDVSVRVHDRERKWTFPILKNGTKIELFQWVKILSWSTVCQQKHNHQNKQKNENCDFSLWLFNHFFVVTQNSLHTFCLTNGFFTEMWHNPTRKSFSNRTRPKCVFLTKK